ncbi:hypothetical protein LNKW23_05780 [Paralimibaculum aggregatum]|uniref:Secreted protein n=1 Tax=Paralimibaculum aggregatum TaxID=3036245 RepID=A0ABQ6LGM4_9RHOB|nr:hypothetical protein [Limibaculum sp. NKW23]GMG81365.1 hypothetical protein LNKW23_05780 [Limibaculum sp. NKW23]
MKRLTRQIVTLTAALALPVLALPSAAEAAPHDRAQRACIQAVKAETGARRLRDVAAARQGSGFRVTGVIVERRGANDRFACNTTRSGAVRKVWIDERGRGTRQGPGGNLDRRDDRRQDGHHGRQDRRDDRYGHSPEADAVRVGVVIGAIVGSLIEEAGRRH